MAPHFGFCVPIFAAPGLPLFRTPCYETLDAGVTKDLALRAEAAGYDALWVADHLMRGQDQAILEGWTTLAALAGATIRARLGLIHQTHFFRHPAVVAKMVATLDQLSGGRFIYFLDCGNQRDEYLAYGLPWSDDIEERVAQMVDGLEVTLALWGTRGAVSYDGPYFHLRDAICNPPPVQTPHPPLWFGGVNPAMLAACARYGQGWNTTPASVEQVREHLKALALACAAAGRSPDSLAKSLEIQILVAPDEAAVRAGVQAIVDAGPTPHVPEPALAAFLAGDTAELPDSWRRTTVIGTPPQVARQLREYVDAGIDHFMLWFLDAPSADGLELFAREVRPAFR